VFESRRPRAIGAFAYPGSVTESDWSWLRGGTMMGHSRRGKFTQGRPVVAAWGM
jgi:hypothetical protein